VRFEDGRSFYSFAAGDANPCLGSLSSDVQLGYRRSKDEAVFRQHFRFSPQAGGFSTIVDNLQYNINVFKFISGFFTFDEMTDFSAYSAAAVVRNFLAIRQ
jgi:hypothetical protein